MALLEPRALAAKGECAPARTSAGRRDCAAKTGSRPVAGLLNRYRSRSLRAAPSGEVPQNAQADQADDENRVAQCSGGQAPSVAGAEDATTE